MPKFSNQEKAQECRRELGQRRHVYPRRIADGKMRQEAATRLIALMEDMQADYEALDAKDRPDLFSNATPAASSDIGIAEKLRHYARFGETPDRAQTLRTAAQLLIDLSTPHEGVRGKQPLVCYFETDTDRDEFIAAVLAVKPNMRCLKV